MLLNFSNRFLIILLDCRTLTDFNSKHIKESVNLDCRNRLIRKRLESRRLNVKDLINKDDINKKFEQKMSPQTCQYHNNKMINDNEPTQIGKQTYLAERQMSNENESSNDVIIIYDDTTCDENDLQIEQNPLRIVQENIKKSEKECKILKGGFKQFQQLWPEFCVEKEQKKCNSFYESKELNEQCQAAIDNAVMTCVTNYLYLGRNK
jgi:hypothetical protein